MIDQDNETADAIRYALLRRLTPGIRHGLMSELQAIESLGELAARQLQANADPAPAREGVSHVIAHARKAVGSCSSIIEWLRPEAGAPSAIAEGVAQYLKVAGDDWPLRGIEATTDLEAPDALVDRATLRELFTASIIALIDMHPGTLDIDVQSVAEGDHVDLTLRARAAERRSSISPSGSERKFTWADVQVLANAHDVSCTFHAHGATLRLRRMALQAT